MSLDGKPPEANASGLGRIEYLIGKSRDRTELTFGDMLLLTDESKFYSWIVECEGILLRDFVALPYETRRNYAVCYAILCIEDALPSSYNCFLPQVSSLFRG